MNVSEVKARHLLNVEITRLQMKWRTTNNSIDCGIFAMRHMETYKGNGVRSWDSKFAPETQKVNMDTLAYVPNLSHSPTTLSFLIQYTVLYYRKEEAILSNFIG